MNGVDYLEWQRAQKWDGRAGPEGYCQGAWGGKVGYVRETEMEEKIEGLRILAKEHSASTQSWWLGVLRDSVKRELSSTYCKTEWTVPHHMVVKEFWCDTMPRLVRLASFGKNNPCHISDIRIVFWFDN